MKELIYFLKNEEATIAVGTALANAVKNEFHKHPIGALRSTQSINAQG